VENGEPAGNPGIQLALGIYQIVCGVIAIYVLTDSWLEQFYVLRIVFPVMDDATVDVGLLKTLTYTVTGSMLGAIVCSLRGLHIYGAVRGVFRTSYVSSYVLGPWFAGFLGVGVYGLLRAGIFVFAGVSEIKDPNAATQFGYVGLGFLAGFGWLQVLEKIDSMIRELLGSPQNEDERLKRSVHEEDDSKGQPVTGPGSSP
jgi:MFS family permease